NANIDRSERVGPVRRLAEDGVDRRDEPAADRHRIAQLDANGSGKRARLFRGKPEGRVAAADLRVDPDAARHERGLAFPLAIDQQVSVDRSLARTAYVDRESGTVLGLFDARVGERGGNLEFTLADDDRHRDAVDRDEV